MSNKIKFSDFKIVPVIDSIKNIEMDDATYFSNKYKKYISNSRLKNIDPAAGGSPKQFKNPPHITSSSLSIGSSVHEILLQPDKFKLGPKLHKPTAKLGQVADYVYEHKSDNIPIENTIIEASQKIGYYVNQIHSKIPNIIEKCTPYWEALSEPRWNKTGIEEIFLSDADYDVVSGCLESCYNNIEIMTMLHPTDSFGEKVESHNEDALFIDFLVTYKDKYCTTLKFKLKIDNWTIDPLSKVVTLNDLKTTSNPVTWFMHPEYGSMIHYNYYRQMYCYGMILWEYCKQNYGVSKKLGWTLDVNMLVVQTRPPYSSKRYWVNRDWLKRGKNEFEELMKRVAYYEIFGYNKNVTFEN